jgi:hypothetical protein
MPHLPKKLAPVRAAVASILSHYLHVGNLYDAGEIANALNIEADVAGNDAINAGVDVTLLLRAFANEGGDDYFLPCNVLGREGSRDVLYVRRAIKYGRQRGNKLSLFIGRFRSSDETKHARVVRWNHGMDVDDKTGLIQFLTELKPSKKRAISQVSPADEDRQPLVEMRPQHNIPVATQPIEKPPSADTIQAQTSSPVPGAAPPPAASAEDKEEELKQSASDACDNSDGEEESSGGAASRRRKRGATQKRVRALTAEVATLKLSLRTLQESHEAREAKRQKRRGILARLREREAELAAATAAAAPSASAPGPYPATVYYVLLL